MTLAEILELKDKTVREMQRLRVRLELLEELISAELYVEKQQTLPLGLPEVPSETVVRQESLGGPFSLIETYRGVLPNLDLFTKKQLAEAIKQVRPDAVFLEKSLDRLVDISIRNGEVVLSRPGKSHNPAIYKRVVPDEKPL